MEDAESRLMAQMDDRSAWLARESGVIQDSRRLVQWIYLMLRDLVPAYIIEEGLRDTLSLRAEDRTHVRSGHIPTASHLTDVQVERVEDFCAMVKKRAFLERAVPYETLMQQISVSDDTTTVFTNGWLALYAIHVADILQSGSETP